MCITLLLLDEISLVEVIVMSCEAENWRIVIKVMYLHVNIIHDTLVSL